SVVFSLENDEEFAEKVSFNFFKVFKFDFYADWCGPCRMLGPRLEAKVQGQGGSVLLAKVDVDLVASLAAQYEITAVPTVIAFKNGEVVEKMEGDCGDEYIDRLIDNLVHVLPMLLILLATK
uniref:Thioredoxin n=1 Tax=Syphacia muris TaxID=451379 RepID=A0A0N5AW65_9BILA